MFKIICALFFFAVYVVNEAIFSSAMNSPISNSCNYLTEDFSFCDYTGTENMNLQHFSGTADQFNDKIENIIKLVVGPFYANSEEYFDDESITNVNLYQWKVNVFNTMSDFLEMFNDPNANFILPAMDFEAFFEHTSGQYSNNIIKDILNWKLSTINKFNPFNSVNFPFSDNDNNEYSSFLDKTVEQSVEWFKDNNEYNSFFDKTVEQSVEWLKDFMTFGESEEESNNEPEESNNEPEESNNEPEETNTAPEN